LRQGGSSVNSDTCLRLAGWVHDTPGRLVELQPFR